MKTFPLVILLGACQSTVFAQENLVINGGFERGFFGWNGTFGYIDHASYALEGSHVGVVIDIAESSIGETMHQTLNTAPNQQYLLRFSLLAAGSRAGEQAPPGHSPVAVSWGGFEVDRVFDSSTVNWKSYEYLVTASSSHTELNFASIGNQYQLIDAISVAAVPEPSVFGLAGMGAVAWLLTALRSRDTAARK